MLAFKSLNHRVVVYLQRSDSIAFNSMVCDVMSHPNSWALLRESSLAHTLTCALLQVMSLPLNPKKAAGQWTSSFERNRLSACNIVQHRSTHLNPLFDPKSIQIWRCNLRRSLPKKMNWIYDRRLMSAVICASLQVPPWPSWPPCPWKKSIRLPVRMAKRKNQLQLLELFSYSRRADFWTSEVWNFGIAA